MRIIEIVAKKPLTPEKSRVRALQMAVDNARAALERERDRQRLQRAHKRQQQL